MSITPEQLGQLNKYKTVLLTEQKFDDSDAAMIAEALRANNNVFILYLCHNKVGNAGTIHIAKSLEFNQTIRLLELTDNGISDEGARALSKALDINTTLVELKLGENEISTNLLNEIKEKLTRNIIYFAEHAHAKIKSCIPTQIPDDFFKEINLAHRVVNNNFEIIATLYPHNTQMLETWLELFNETHGLMLLGNSLSGLEKNPLNGLRQYKIISDACSSELVKAEMLFRGENGITDDQTTRPFKNYLDTLFKINQWKDELGQNSVMNIMHQLERISLIETSVVIYPFVQAVIENIRQDLQILSKTVYAQTNQGTLTPSISFVMKQIEKIEDRKDSINSESKLKK